MTDNEIIEEFELFIKYSAPERLMDDVLDLINRQKAEIEKLKSWVLTFTNGVVIDGSGYYIKELSYDVITNRAKKCKAEIKAEAIKGVAAEFYNSFAQYETYDRLHTFEVLDRINSVEEFLLNNLEKEKEGDTNE